MPLSATTEGPGRVELADVLSAFGEHHPGVSADGIVTAYELAAQAHQGQVRKTGDHFITHPLAVALILAQYGLDAATLEAALLHDTVEDTELTLEQIRSNFGETVARLIDGVTKLDRLDYSNREQAQAATIRKMVVAMAQDVRVLLIKLVDRLHNMRTVGALRREKQERVATETLDIYTPLAHRLGVQEIKHELEDRCFEILYPGPFAEIEAKLAVRAPERDIFIEKMTNEISALLEESGIDAEVSGRPKHHYSIYRKMMEQGRPFEEIHDLIGIRVVAASTQDCYAALGLVHSNWVPVAGRFKDYIAMPKINLYQSLHTTVIGPDGKPLEIQIRTSDMHRRAESGVAAHWRYKEGAVEEGMNWVDVESIHDEDDLDEFLANLKLDLYEDEVFVLTPAGDVKALPRGATAIDFAYSVHTEVGHRCVGARINGRLLPLPTRLESGDIVEIITSNAVDAGPSRDWLSVVRTSRARSKIKQWYLKERREQAVTEGRETVAAVFKREASDLSSKEREELLGQIAPDLGKPDVEALLAAVGEGTISPDTIAARINRILTPDTGDELFTPRRRPRTHSTEVIVEGQDDMLVTVAQCCSPVPGDPIVGYVTVGRGVSVHRSDCTNVASLSERPERTVDVAWPPRNEAFAVWIQVEALDRTRLLRDVTSVVSDTGGNITASSTLVDGDRVATLRYEVELSDPGQLPKLLADLRGVDGVFNAFRIANDPASA